MITIPYTYIAIILCVLVLFFKIGELDKEIGWAIGLGTGLLVLVLDYFLPGGFLGLVLYALGGYALLTVYKILRSLPERGGKNCDDNE